MKFHYQKSYFDWQKKAGMYSGEQDLWKFQPYIKETDTVLDFGCGGGYVLGNISCKRKYGVEINSIAAKVAESQGLHVYKKLSDIPKNIKFDAIFSHHTLEHLENPAEVLKEMHSYLKEGGLGVHVVPIDIWQKEKFYKPGDINQHFFTWTPLLLGNLVAHLGYEIKKVDQYPYQWLPLSRYYFKSFPRSLYYPLAKAWGIILNVREIHLVARKKRK